MLLKMQKVFINCLPLLLKSDIYYSLYREIPAEYVLGSYSKIVY